MRIIKKDLPTFPFTEKFAASSTFPSYQLNRYADRFSGPHFTTKKKFSLVFPFEAIKFDYSLFCFFNREASLKTRPDILDWFPSN